MFHSGVVVEEASAWSIFRQALPILMVSLVAGLVAGTVLGSEAMREGIEAVPGLLLLLPAFLATRGGVYGAMGARLASGLHQGVIKPVFEWSERMTNAIVASFVNGMVVSLFIGALTWFVLVAVGREGGLVQLVLIMAVAGFLSALLMLSVLIVVMFWGYRRGFDPDNLIGPTVTTLGDVFGIVFLLVAVYVVGWVV